jgi:signal peptidase I
VKVSKRILLVTVVVAPAAVILLFWVSFQVFSMPTTSMEDAVLLGDRLIARKLDRRTPHRGEILIFRRSGNYSLRRVVAIAGDHVHLHEKNLYINGVEQHEPFVKHLDSQFVQYRDEFPSDPGWSAMGGPAWAAFVRASAAAGDIVVPPASCFALGDNRDQSADSRYVGFYREDEIAGKPVMVLFSIKPAMPRLTGPNEWGTVRWNRFLKIL